MGGFAFAGYAARTLPIRSRTLQGHYEGTKSRLGHYRGQQVSTGENGKSTGNALVSAESKRVEKVYTHVRDVGAASSNLVTSTIENARSFGKFPGLRAFWFCEKSSSTTLSTAILAQKPAVQNRKPPPKLQYFGAVFILCLFVIFPCHVMQETMRHTKKPPQDNLTSHNGFFMYTWTF